MLTTTLEIYMKRCQFMNSWICKNLIHLWKSTMQIIHYHCGVFFQSCVFISFLPSLEIMRWCIIRISLQYNIKKEISKLLFNTFIICYVILFCIVMSKLQQKYLNVVKIIKSKRFKQRTNLFVFTKGICFQK